MNYKQEREQRLVTLAVINNMEKKIAETKTAAATWLKENALAPGDRVSVVVDGADIGTVSRSKISQNETLVITDPTAYGEWLEANGKPITWKKVPADYILAPKAVEAICAELAKESPGELPDGVTIQVKETGGSVSCRVSAEQAAALRYTAPATRAVLDGLRMIEPGEQA